MKTRLFAPLAAAALAIAAVVGLACGSGSDAATGAPADSGAAFTESLAALLGEGESAAGMSVAGLGTAAAAPDIASLSVGVSSLADTARAAREDAATRVTDLIASLKDNGIADEDFHTSQFSIDPEIDYRTNGDQVIRGYRVTSMLAVKVRELDRVGEVIDDAVEAVGDPIRVSGVTFSIEDMAALQGEARAMAVADAKAKAEELAGLTGVTLGKPLAISESSVGGQPPVFFDLRAAQSADVETPISPGQLEITVTVQITYAIS